MVDLFAGGGGASTGIEQAIGRHVDIAINHDPEAVSLHEANHPQTRHFVSDVFEVDPLTVTAGQPLYRVYADFPADLEFARQATQRSDAYALGTTDQVPRVFVEF